MNSLDVYCVCHKGDDYDRLKIENLNNLHIYYTKGNHQNSLDSLQLFFCEFTSMYYVWKNNLITSSYIGFEHYSRPNMRNYIGTAMDKDVYYLNTFNGTLNWYLTNRFAGFLKDDFIKYIKDNYTINDNPYKIYISELNVDKPWVSNECFVCKSEIFEEMMNCLGGFFEYINDKYNLEWNFDKYKLFIQEKFIGVKDWYNLPDNEIWMIRNNFKNAYRIIAYLIEVLLGYYIAYFSK